MSGRRKAPTDDFLEGMLDYYVYNDKVIGIPFNYDPRAMYHPPTCWRKRAWKCPTTYDEFIDVTSKTLPILPTNLRLHVSVVKARGWPVQFMSMATGNGGMLYDKDGNANINSERNLQVMKFFRALKDAGCLPDGIEGYADSDCTKLFASGGQGWYLLQIRWRLQKRCDQRWLHHRSGQDPGSAEIALRCAEGSAVRERLPGIRAV